MTAFITVHNIPFSISSHLSKLVLQMCPDSVIAKGIAYTICAKLKVNNFSILVDGASDSVGRKHLYVVRTVDSDFKEGGIELQDNLLGMAGDGANVIVGANNSLYSRLKEVVHQLFIMKCICHSFHLCASKASQKLPSFIEQLTCDIYSYVSCSLKRISTLREFQEFVGTEPHKILHPAQTRWLSFFPVVKRVIKQYQALILFFHNGSLSEGIPAA
ncbi:hypothetical protein PR048_009938 [Dryococelus australis]|uniref:DUF4371 domain-containing protein n=1 Tax=Dryococelus australis TaxID=614101 RepID=A0ABQ9I1B1_9NEOP|nr:hypothetical protein PR048_009938 [Dryococelus australis]